MSTDRPGETTTSSVDRMLEIFDVEPTGGRRFAGVSDGGGRRVVDGSQLLAQAIVACAKSFPRHAVRRADATFLRAVDDRHPLWFDVEVLHEGRTVAGAVTTVGQGERRCASVTVLMDVPQVSVIEHRSPLPPVGAPADAVPCAMPMVGRELRLAGVHDPNDPDEVGPPVLDAWLRYAAIPDDPAMAKALIAHFTGHLSISATMRAHPGVGTSMAHRDLSTGVMAISVTFHDPVTWREWLLYHHESAHVGSGMSYVRGQVFTEEGVLLASFSQDAMIRAFDSRADGVAKPVAERL
jgi:acyl-CoA thioesterase II